MLGLLSDGVHHDDDLVHFLMARWSWWCPGYLLNAWGRPGMTIPMAAVSGLSDVETAWHAARILSAVVSMAAAALAAQVAGRLGVDRPWRVMLFCYLQPLYSLLSFTTLTENFTALYLVGAVWLLSGRRIMLATGVFSMALLTRHEAVAFVPIWVIGLWLAGLRGGRWIGTAVLSLWAPIAHNLFSGLLLGAWPAQVFLHAKGSTEYLPTGWGAYIPDTVYALTPALFMLAAIGATRFVDLRNVPGRKPVDADRAAWFCVVSFAFGFFLLHAVIKAVGVYASGGFPRFMVAVSPFFAILAVVGWDHVKGAVRLAGKRAAFLAIAIGWCIIWVACESELAAGRLPKIPDPLLLTLRIVLGVQFVGAAAAAMTSGRHQIGRMAGIAVVCMLMLLTTGQLFAIVRPLSLKPIHRAVADTIRTLDRRGLGDRPVFAANPWFAYGLGLIEDRRSVKDAELLASMPVGTLLIWDPIYSESDYHAMRLDEILASGAYEPLFQMPIESSPEQILVYEKRHETLPPKRKRRSFPPPIEDGSPPVRGIYYQLDRVRPARYLRG